VSVFFIFNNKKETPMTIVKIFKKIFKKVEIGTFYLYVESLILLLTSPNNMAPTMVSTVKEKLFSQKVA